MYNAIDVLEALDPNLLDNIIILKEEYILQSSMKDFLSITEEFTIADLDNGFTDEIFLAYGDPTKNSTKTHFNGKIGVSCCGGHITLYIPSNASKYIHLFKKYSFYTYDNYTFEETVKDIIKILKEYES